MPRIGSKHADGISGPLKTSLSNPKRICCWPNAAEVNIDPHTVNVISQLRRPRRAQELVAGVSDQPDIVGPFFASNRKIKNQMLSASRNLQRGRLLDCCTSQTTNYAQLET